MRQGVETATNVVSMSSYLGIPDLAALKMTVQQLHLYEWDQQPMLTSLIIPSCIGGIKKKG